MRQPWRTFSLAPLFFLSLVVPLRAVNGPHSVDALTSEHSEIAFLDEAYAVAFQSVSTGRQAVLTTHVLSNSETDPGLLEVTFELVYADGYVASGTGYLVVGSLPELGGSATHPFGHLFALTRLTVSSTNRGRGGPWPKVGDELIEESEVDSDGFLEGSLRIVRPD